MNNRKIDKRLAEAEDKIGSINTNAELETEFHEWALNNPLEDGPDFNFENWFDSMPVKCEPFFTMSILNLFPQLKISYSA